MLSIRPEETHISLLSKKLGLYILAVRSLTSHARIYTY